MSKTNHIKHHQAQKSITLKRQAVKKLELQPILVTNNRMKAQAILTRPSKSLESNLSFSLNLSRLEKARQVKQSNFIEHFAKPDNRTFKHNSTPTTRPIIHPPKQEEDLSLGQILEKVIDKLETFEADKIAKKPPSRFITLTKSMVANRFNGITVD